MKKIIIGGIVALASILAPQPAQAQGTMAYLSNVDQPSAGSFAVGSDSWLAAGFATGTNASGYTLDSIQLRMADASGTPSGFTVMLYTMAVNAGLPGHSLATLDSSLSPITGGIFSYTPTSSLTLFPRTHYFIVLTAGTAIANGAYDWSNVDPNSYNPSGGWVGFGGGVLTSSDGSFWSSISGNSAQFAINATAIPEPGVLGLLGLGGLAFFWHRRKAKAL